MSTTYAVRPAPASLLIDSAPTYVSDTAVRIASCLGRLRAALLIKAADQEHLHTPYPTFRDWLAGIGFDWIIHPAWGELLTLTSTADARARFARLANDVLIERHGAVICNGCRGRVALIVCEIDHDEIVLCPRCSAVEVDRLIPACEPERGRVAA